MKNILLTVDRLSTWIGQAFAWLIIALMVLGGLAAIIALMLLGVRTFWASGAVTAPRLQFSEAVPVGALVLACVLLPAIAVSAMPPGLA